MPKKKLTSSDLYYDYMLCLKMREDEYRNMKISNLQSTQRMNELIEIENNIKSEINNVLNNYITCSKK